MLSLICAWTIGWVNNRDATDLRRHRAHYDVTVMSRAYVRWCHSLCIDYATVKVIWGSINFDRLAPCWLILIRGHWLSQEEEFNERCRIITPNQICMHHESHFLSKFSSGHLQCGQLTINLFVVMTIQMFLSCFICYQINFQFHVLRHIFWCCTFNHNTRRCTHKVNRLRAGCLWRNYNCISCYFSQMRQRMKWTSFLADARNSFITLANALVSDGLASS